MTRNRMVSALWLCALGLVAGLAIAVGAALTAAATAGALATRPGAWTTTIVPIDRLPALSFDVNVPGVVRLALSPIGRRLLDGRARATRFGRVSFRRHGGTLIVSCTPCRIDDPRLAARPVELPLELRLTPDAGGERNGRVDGVLATQGVLVAFTARLEPERIDVAWSVPETEVATLVRLLAAAIPEAASAQIRGTFAAEGVLELPTQRAGASLRLDGLAVDGLGTGSLAYGMFEQRCTDATGAPKGIINGPGSRFWMPLEEFGQTLPAAVLAAEDQRFFGHAGYDDREIAPALARFDASLPPAAAPKRSLRGASTLTQQLARTLFTGGERSATRKLRELLYAVEMERTLGKQRILELYLNTVDWGPGLCGARSAARTYFRKPPQRLSALEAAWLAASLRDPRRAYEREFLAGRADAARTLGVLAQMRTLPASERARAARQPLVFARAPRKTPIAQSAASH